MNIVYETPISDLQLKRQANDALTFVQSLSQMKIDALQFLDGYAFAKWLATKLNVPVDLIKKQIPKEILIEGEK
jgi:hypothetical protein